MQKRKEGSEALMRIVVGVVSGIILGIWKMLVTLLIVIHFFMVLFTGKRQKGIADFCEIWNTQLYIFIRYMAFVSNARPFPFDEIAPNLSKFE